MVASFTAQFILAFIVTMPYYGINIIYPVMINAFYVSSTTSRSEEMLLTLPENLGMVLGAVLLSCFGNLLWHWKIVAAASTAFKCAVAHGLKIPALSSMGFAGVGLVYSLLLEDTGHKMNDKTEVFLENDVNAEKNVHH
jgi:hypothetical protein